MNYQERQDRWVKENNVKHGDTVKVLFAVPSNALGWDAHWVAHMDGAVGCECTALTEIQHPGLITPGWDARGIRLDPPSGRMAHFPYFCLEKVEKPKKELIGECVSDAFKGINALKKVEAIEERVTSENEKMHRRIDDLGENISRHMDAELAELRKRVNDVHDVGIARRARADRSRKEIHERIDAEVCRILLRIERLEHPKEDTDGQ